MTDTTYAPYSEYLIRTQPFEGEATLLRFTGTYADALAFWRTVADELPEGTRYRILVGNKDGMGYPLRSVSRSR